MRGEPSQVEGLFASAEGRLLIVDSHGRFATAGEALESLRTATCFAYDPDQHWLLGRLDGLTYFAAHGELEDGSTLREASPALESGQLELAATAVALSAWHRHDSRCPACGGATQIQAAGFARYCSADDRSIFPRTDPAVIVAVTDADDRLLLAHQATWGEGRVSVLAGFVEAGESLEHTVHREILEESGVPVTDIAYFGSQPWPFPRSLMVAFTARALSTEIRVDGQEITWGRWFTRQELQTEVAAGRIGLPGKASIASRMIKAWLEAEAS